MEIWPVSSDTIVLKVKASGNHYIGWFFVNPENGEEIAGADLPKTFNGKKVESAVTNMVNGRRITNREALGNPESLDYFEALLPELQK